MASPFDPDPGNAVASLVIAPFPDTLTSIADTIVFTARAYNGSGEEVTGGGVSWHSSDRGVVRVDQDGTAISRANGTVWIVATLDLVSDSVPLVVAQRPSAIDVVLHKDTLHAIGETVPAISQTYDANGFAIAKSGVVWASSDRTVAVVSATGVVTAVGNGTAFIRASAGGVSDSVALSVRQLPTALMILPGEPTLAAIGETMQLTATAFDAEGRVMPVESIEWSASNEGVASVSVAGVVTAVGNGVAFVRAAVEDAIDSVRVEVDQLAVSLDLLSDVDTLDALGATVTLEWSARDARGHPVTAGPVQWIISNPSIAQIEEGVVTSVSNGEVMVMATLDDAADTVNLIVKQAPVSLSIDPFRTTVAEGDTMHLTASLRDRNDSLIADEPIRWAVSDSTIAFVDQSGILYAFSLGPVAVTAQAEGFSDERSVMVDPLFSTFGLNFSPFLDGQDPSFVVSEQQIRDRVALIAPYTQWIRTFGCRGGLDATGMIAREFGLQIAMGAWLGTNQASNEEEIDCLIQRARAGEVDIAIVGGEVLFRGDLGEDELIAHIRRTKAALPGIPVTYNDTHGQLVAHPRVIAEVDLVLANFYPFWEGVAIGDAITALDISFWNLVAISGGKPVIVGETGWPTCGYQIGDAHPTPTNGARFFYDFLEWTRLNHVESFYFSAYDEAWKTINEGPLGACWGLWDSVGQLKLPSGPAS